MTEAAVSQPGLPVGLIVFMGVWFALGIAGWLLFYVSRNVAFKRRFFVPYILLVGGLFLVLPIANGSPFSIYLILVPAITLISFLNIRSTQFCDACGRTLLSRAFFSRASFCAKCGAKLSDA
jgi:hypothetical protein